MKRDSPWKKGRLTIGVKGQFFTGVEFFLGNDTSRDQHQRQSEEDEEQRNTGHSEG